jgi:hypothetical protein
LLTARGLAWVAAAVAAAGVWGCSASSAAPPEKPLDGGVARHADARGGDAGVLSDASRAPPRRDASDAGGGRKDGALGGHDARSHGDAPDDAPSDGAPTGHDAHDARSPADAADAADDRREAAAKDAGETCSDGVPVAYTRAACLGTPAAVPTALASAVSSAAVGDVFSLDGLDEGSLPCFPVRVCVPAAAPTLIFSDDPESPSSDGILYADQLVAGPYRAYVYHSNAGSALRSFAVVLLNEGATTVHATVTGAGVAGPSQDYILVGKDALSRWLSSMGSAPVATVDVPPGQRVLLSSTLAALEASTNDLVHAILDFSLDGPVKLSVVSVLPSEDPTTVTASLPLLPDDGVHARGTFPGAALELEATVPLDGAGARHLRLGGGVTDETLQGRDYVDAKDVTLGGNYGVSYLVRADVTAATGFFLSPQGGAWGGVLSAGSTPTPLPTSEDAVASQTEGIALFALEGGETASATFLTAGGSSLPVDLVAVPTQ